MNPYKLLLSFVFSLLMAEAAVALPLTGVYYQLGNVAELEMYDGMLHAGYWSGKSPATESGVSTNRADSTWDLALRAPFVLTENEKWTMKGFLGYHLQMASTVTPGGVGITDNASGIQSGAFFTYRLSPDIQLLADYLMTKLMSGSSTFNSIGFNSLILDRFEAGIAFKLPQGGNIMAGYSSWSLPKELGSGMNFSGQTLRVEGLTVGINYQIFP